MYEVTIPMCKCGNAMRGEFTKDQCRICWKSLNFPLWLQKARKLSGIITDCCFHIVPKELIVTFEKSKVTISYTNLKWEGNLSNKKIELTCVENDFVITYDNKKEFATFTSSNPLEIQFYFNKKLLLVNSARR